MGKEEQNKLIPASLAVTGWEQSVAESAFSEDAKSRQDKSLFLKTSEILAYFFPLLLQAQHCSDTDAHHRAQTLYYLPAGIYFTECRWRIQSLKAEVLKEQFKSPHPSSGTPKHQLTRGWGGRVRNCTPFSYSIYCKTYFLITVLKELITLFSPFPPALSVRFINIFPSSSLLKPSSSVKTTLTTSPNSPSSE